MTLDEAIEVMNQRAHNGETAWGRKWSQPKPDGEQWVTDSEGYYYSPHYTPWECEAIAEKYLRDAQ